MSYACVSSHGTFTQKKQNKHGRGVGYEKRKKKVLYEEKKKFDLFVLLLMIS